MAKVIDYVKSANERVKLKNFNEKDAIVLNLLSYLHFDGLKDRTKLRDMAEAAPQVVKNTRVPEANKALLLACGESPRYAKVRLYRYNEETNIKEVKQFAAVTFFIDWRTIYVAFRGTDGTMVGWQEDLNLAFMDEIPAQAQAKEYLRRIVKKYFWCKIIVGGHSKGGNLAVYAGMKVEPKYEKRVPAIYNMDGPGFKKTLYESEQFRAVRSKVTKIVPEYSVIGMLLQDEGEYRVVKSDGEWLLQHDMYNWIFDEKTWELHYLPYLHMDAVRMNKTIYDWLSNIEEDKRELIIENLFDILRSGGSVTIADFSEHWKENMREIFAKYRSYDKDQRVLLRKSLVGLAKDVVMNSLKRKKQK